MWKIICVPLGIIGVGIAGLYLWNKRRTRLNLEIQDAVVGLVANGINARLNGRSDLPDVLLLQSRISHDVETRLGDAEIRVEHAGPLTKQSVVDILRQYIGVIPNADEIILAIELASSGNLSMWNRVYFHTHKEGKLEIVSDCGKGSICYQVDSY